MSRYIDAEWLKELYKPYESYNGKELAVPIGAILANIDDAPSIDIVRCQDCKYWQMDWTPEEGVGNYHYCPVVDRSTFDDWYCADGERKESE